MVRVIGLETLKGLRYTNHTISGCGWRWSNSPFYNTQDPRWLGTRNTIWSPRRYEHRQNESSVEGHFYVLVLRLRHRIGLFQGEEMGQIRIYSDAVPGIKLFNMLEMGDTPIVPPKELRDIGSVIEAFPLTIIRSYLHATV